eukprot:c24492_g2_i3 orf=738-1904(+)
MTLDIKTTGPDFTVQIKDFVIYAVLKLTFKPHKEEFPGFGAVVFCLREPPLIDFQTKFLTGDVGRLPGVQKAVDNLLLTMLMDMLVWPSRLVLPVAAGDYSFLEAKTIGYLIVELLEAKELANKEVVGKCDPYIVLYIQRRPDCIKESTKMLNMTSPIWNEIFTFNVEDLEAQSLTVRLMDVDTLNPADYIGSAVLPISQFGVNVQDIWVDLAGHPNKLHGKCPGRVHLLIRYMPIQSSQSESQTAEAVVKKKQRTNSVAESVTKSEGMTIETVMMPLLVHKAVETAIPDASGERNCREGLTQPATYGDASEESFTHSEIVKQGTIEKMDFKTQETCETQWSSNGGSNIVAGHENRVQAANEQERKVAVEINQLPGEVILAAELLEVD